MPNVCLAAGLRRTALISLFWVGNSLAWEQVHFGHPYDASMGQSPLGYPGWGPPVLDSMPSFPQSALLAPAGPATVSTDVSRHPLSLKARRLFEKAMHHAELGNHAAAIQGLQDALAKDPSSAPYARNLLGMEYIETRQFSDAITCFEEAARLMPHESANHFNYGLSLTIIGEWDSAEQEVRKALQLDHSNSKAKLILETLLRLKHTRSAPARP
jgi:Tetratricopeptide repeat